MNIQAFFAAIFLSLFTRMKPNNTEQISDDFRYIIKQQNN